MFFGKLTRETITRIVQQKVDIILVVINDIFTFEFQAASIAEFECVIVNRWGVVMAELNDITDGWDGNDLGGSPAADGTYFYVYKATTDNSTKLEGQGTIQLVRGQ